MNALAFAVRSAQTQSLETTSNRRMKQMVRRQSCFVSDINRRLDKQTKQPDRQTQTWTDQPGQTDNRLDKGPEPLTLHGTTRLRQYGTDKLANQTVFRNLMGP